MAYHLLIEESVGEGIKRIVREQIDKALAEISDDKLDRHITVHQVRKRCKKIRAVLRLVRPGFEDTYRFENAWFRDAARALSFVRDAEAMLETYAKLIEAGHGQVDFEVLGPVRQALIVRRQRVADDQIALEERLASFRAHMEEARDRIDLWSIETEGFAAIDLQKTYRRGRNALSKAYLDLTTEQFHEWRKRVKYHRYHSYLLRQIWTPIMTQFHSEIKELSDLLGDEHDLAVFRQTLLANPDEFSDPSHIQAIIDLIDRRRDQLQTQAKPLGERVFAEKPRHLSRRLRGYWQAWRSQTG